MNHQPRSFEDQAAVRENVPLLVGLMGPSGSGKTYSALWLSLRTWECEMERYFPMRGV